MKKKKLMAYLMTAAIIGTVLPANVFAEESQTQEITGESLVDGKKTISVPIEGTINPEFSVKIPSKINISQGENGYGYTGKISVKGAIGLGASVKIKADDSVTLYDVTNRTSQDIPANAEDQDYTHNTEKTAPVTQEKSVWEQTELDPNTYTDSGISCAVGNLQIGTWKGKTDKGYVEYTFRDDNSGNKKAESESREFIYYTNYPQSGKLTLYLEDDSAIVFIVNNITETTLNCTDADTNERITLTKQ